MEWAEAVAARERANSDRRGARTAQALEGLSAECEKRLGRSWKC